MRKIIVLSMITLDGVMQARGQLMIEHRPIERMLTIIQGALADVEKTKQSLLIFALLTLFASSSGAADLKKLNLDNASAIGTTIQTDTRVKAEGKGSIRITTQWPTTICLGEVTGLDIDGASLVYKAKLKSDLEGTAFLEMWAHVGGGQYFSRGLDNVVTQKTDWKVIQTPFLFQKGQRPDKVTLNIVINGKGTVWIDDIVLSKEPLK